MQEFSSNLLIEAIHNCPCCLPSCVMTDVVVMVLVVYRQERREKGTQNVFIGGVKECIQGYFSIRVCYTRA